MPKKIKKKIFKVKKSKAIDADHFVVRFKGLDKTEQKKLRADLDEFCQEYIESEDELVLDEKLGR